MAKNKSPEFREAQSKRMLAKSARGEHPLQGDVHGMRMSERNRDLAARGEHPWQDREFREKHSKIISKVQKSLSARGAHNRQGPISKWEHPDHGTFIGRMMDLIKHAEEKFDQDLNPGALLQIRRGTRKTHKGWTCLEAEVNRSE